MDLLTAFRSLARPDIESGPNTFSVLAIAGSPHRIGKDGSGKPVLLIHTAAATGQTGPVVLRHIAVQHDVLCRIASNTGGSSHEALMSIVRCASGEPTLREYFVRAVEIAIRLLGDSPSHAEVSRAIGSLTELFRAFEQPARRTVQGLWAELMVIALAESPSMLVAAWHGDPDEAFDFAAGPHRLEVKSFSGQARIHSFSLRQVRPGTGVEAVIASIRAERSSGGTSIADLVVELAERGVANDMMEKVELVVAQSLGDVAGTGLSLTFDRERARTSLRFFDAHSVPSIDPVLPRGVINARFDSLLDEATALSLPGLRARGPLFREIAPE